MIIVDRLRQSGSQVDICRMLRNQTPIETEKAFVFLYPQPEIINFEIKRRSFGCLEGTEPWITGNT